jgi:hypothetical protein
MDSDMEERIEYVQKMELEVKVTKVVKITTRVSMWGNLLQRHPFRVEFRVSNFADFPMALHNSH